VEVDGSTYIFTAELFRAPVDANMRVAVWKRSNASNVDGWERVTTIAQSNQSFPMSRFQQQCNEPWCTLRVFRRDVPLENAIGSHACSLAASMRATNSIRLGSTF
jgi:hypothetical protein